MMKLNRWFFSALAAAWLCVSAQAQRQAAAVATVISGFLVSVRVTDGGAGYLVAPTVTISGGGGSGAVVVATISNGAVDMIEMTHAGSGYTSTPIVIISAPTLVKPPFSDGLVAYYPLNGNPNDESGNGNHGSATSVAYAADRAGEPNGSAQFDGSASVIEVARSPSLALSSAVTISCWVLNELPAGAHHFLVGMENYYGLVHSKLQISQSGSLLFYNTRCFLDFPVQAYQAQWAHYVGVSDGAHSFLYVNGQLAHSANDAAIPLAPNTGLLTMGRLPYTLPAFGWLPFKGRMDEVRLYNRALSAREVEDLYHYEAPEPPALEIAVKTVQIKMRLKPARKYQVQASADLRTWANLGPPFLATTAEVLQEFNVSETGRYFRVNEVP